jgi:two-component system, OmpR family, sensor histidine kinase VicK
MLWKKAILAKQMIKEIEEGIKREFIETIQDSEETNSLISKVLSSATEEILIIFSHANILHQYHNQGIIDLLKQKATDEIAVRILVGQGNDIELLNGYQRIELRHLLKSIQTRLTTIVTDRELSLVIEEKEDENSIGLATYSNSESTVFSYASIFENLWIQSEIKQQ